MSVVISFRLNPDNPREAEALTILDDWLSQGFSTRYTITEALLNLDSSNSQTPDKEIWNDLSNQIKELLASIEIDASLRKTNNNSSLQMQLSGGFISSILKVAKPGLKPEE